MDAVIQRRARSARIEPPPGGTRGVLEAAAEAIRLARPATLALVVATEGSTYVDAGAAALFDADGAATGWLSGGCLERTVAERARDVAQAGSIAWLDLDTRDDEALFSGAASGCRGRLRIALLPVGALPGFEALVARWAVQGRPLAWRIERGGVVRASCDEAARHWTLAAEPVPWRDADAAWHVAQVAPLRVLACGTGPEASTLLPLLRTLGMVVTAVEQRPRWTTHARGADARHALAPRAGIEALGARHDAALVMHHAFERDLDSLEALARCTTPYIGLLGPRRRRDELLGLLSAQARTALVPRLRAPIGLDLGGRGPEAIALGIAAELQQFSRTRA